MIPGFINYKFMDGEIHEHTKSAFTEYKIIIIHEKLICIRRIRNFPWLLPPLYQ